MSEKIHTMTILDDGKYQERRCFFCWKQKMVSKILVYNRLCYATCDPCASTTTWGQALCPACTEQPDALKYHREEYFCPKTARFSCVKSAKRAQ